MSEVTWQGAGAQSFKAQDIQRQVDEARAGTQGIGGELGQEHGALPGRIGANDGVTAPMSRNKNGTFAVGNPGGPGRPGIPREKAIINALSERYPPETILAMYAEAWSVADTTRGKMLVIADLVDRIAGKPVQYVQNDGDSLDVFLARLRSG